MARLEPNRSPASAPPATAAAVLGPQPASGRPQAGRGAVHDLGDAGVAASAAVLPGYADGEVGVAAAAEVPGGEGSAEPVAGLGGLREPRAVLGQDLAAGRAEEGLGAVDDVDGAGVPAPVAAFVRHPDNEVVVAVVAKVAHGEGGAEPVAALGGLADPGGVLGPPLDAAGVQPLTRAVDDDDGSAVGGGGVVEGNPDREVAGGSAGEVARGEAGAEAVPGLGVSRTPALSPDATWLPRPTRPSGEPKMTWTRPTSRWERSSPGEPTARSVNKSPAAIADPNWSPVSARSFVFSLSCVHSWRPPEPGPPDAEP